MDNYFNPHMESDELQKVSSIALAHVGDAVYELLVRTKLCETGKLTGKELHRATIQKVCAESQAKKAEMILAHLTEEELAVYKRGRNANVHTIPHHASRADYGKATALEALFGYLHLVGRQERILELFHLMEN